MLYFNDLYTPKSLLQKYPNSLYFNWNASKVGIFLKCFLLVGKDKTTKKSALIRENSFKELMNYCECVNSSVTNNKNRELYTPLELYEILPSVITLNWDAPTIGMFYKNGLLLGVSRGNRSSLILLDSYKRLIDYANDNVERRKAQY